MKSVLLMLALCGLAAPAAAQDTGGGSAPQAPVIAASSGAPSLDSLGVKKYLLGPGDVLDLRVYNESQFNGPLVVDDEGNITVPFIETPISAQCRSDREIKADIIKALARYLNRPQVSLRLTEAKSRPPAVVFGAVRSPSRVQMQRRVKLLDLLATSGGVTDAAGGDIQIFHTEPVMCPEAEPEGEIAAVPVDSYKPDDPTQVGYDVFSLRELKDGKKEANPVIRPGDIVIVQEAQPVYITGAVRAPQGIYLKNGMQLKQAIAMVGGLAKEAKASEIVIWRRKKGQSEPEKMLVNYNDIKKEKAKDIDLQPYDIIEVADNSGSFGVRIRDLLIGGGAGSITSIAQTLPLRVIY
ncbi:MAG TPA: SLBB domain-containing protein [Pyrinomonadaceae bacterium]